MFIFQLSELKSQSDVWSIGNNTLNFTNVVNPIIPLPLGDAYKFLSEFPNIALNITNAQNYVYKGEKPVYSQNVVYDDNNTVKFFVIDGNVYNHEGILIANGAYNDVVFTDHYYYLPEGNVETAIVPVPGECNSYFVIAASNAENLTGIVTEPYLRDFNTTAYMYFYKIDFNQPHLDIDYNDNHKMGLITWVGNPLTFSEQCPVAHIAITKPIDGNGNRYMYSSHCNDTYKYIITSSGVSNPTITYSSQVPLTYVNQIAAVRAEAEVIHKENGKFILAKPMEVLVGSPTGPMYVPLIEIREFNDSDGEGDFPSTDGRRLFYLTFFSFSDYEVTGIELTPDGNGIYVVTREYPYLWIGDISENNVPPSIAPGGADGDPTNIFIINIYPIFSGPNTGPPVVDETYYLGSQIELAKDGKLYFYDGKDNFVTVDNINDVNNPVIGYFNTGQILDNYASSGTEIFSEPGEYYYCHLLIDQIDGENYSSFNAPSEECCNDEIAYDIDYNTSNSDYIINSNISWSATNTPWGSEIGSINGNIVVESGGKLNLNNVTLKFSNDSKVIIKQGGLLVVNNSTLTSVDCEGIMWQGIEVYGTQGIAHSTQFNSSYGTIVLQNNSIISNALNGITTCPRNGNTLDLTQSGGYVIANSSSLIDNRIDVDFTPHLYVGSPSLFPPEITKSYFRNCTFKTTGALKDGSMTESHAKLTQVRGIKFISNTFINSDNSNPIVTQRGTGISSIDSKFYVTYSCSSPQSPGNPCPEQDRIGNTFQNLYYGINAQAGSLLNNMVVEHNDFVNTHRGIRMVGMLAAKVDENNFEVGADSPGTNLESHGIHMTGCSKYFCQNNTFTTNFNGDYGIVTVSSGGSNNEIRNNIFNGLKYSATASLTNFGLDDNGRDIGLQYLCNEFYNSSYVDVQVPSGGVHNGQGECNPGDPFVEIDEQPANNTFSFPVPPALHFSIDQNTVLHQTFYHHSGNNLSSFDIIPDNIPSNVFDKLNCGPSTFPVIKSDVCAEREYTQLSTNQLFSNITLTKNLIADYYELIDANNTTGLLAVISTQSAGEVKNLLLVASPYLSDEVLLAYIASNPPAGN